MSKTILIIDDEPVIMKYLIMRMEKSGYQVLTARDGEAGFQSAAQNLPDLVLLDVKLPKCSGYEVFRRLREDENLKNIPVIFSTADADFSPPPSPEGAGSSDYILKPFEAADLFLKIEKYIHSS